MEKVVALFSVLVGEAKSFLDGPVSPCRECTDAESLSSLLSGSYLLGLSWDCGSSVTELNCRTYSSGGVGGMVMGM